MQDRLFSARGSPFQNSVLSLVRNSLIFLNYVVSCKNCLCSGKEYMEQGLGFFGRELHYLGLTFLAVFSPVLSLLLI